MDTRVKPAHEPHKWLHEWLRRNPDNLNQIVPVDFSL